MALGLMNIGLLSSLVTAGALGPFVKMGRRRLQANNLIHIHKGMELWGDTPCSRKGYIQYTVMLQWLTEEI